MGSKSAVHALSGVAYGTARKSSNRSQKQPVPTAPSSARTRCIACVPFAKPTDHCAGLENASRRPTVSEGGTRMSSSPYIRSTGMSVVGSCSCQASGA